MHEKNEYIVSCEQEGISILKNVEPSPEIGFFDMKDPNNPCIGKLTWYDNIFKFEGNAEESAKIFFDFINNHFNINKCKCQEEKKDVGNNCCGSNCSCSV